jgi:hypothetical protein
VLSGGWRLLHVAAHRTLDAGAERAADVEPTGLSSVLTSRM